MLLEQVSFFKNGINYENLRWGAIGIALGLSFVSLLVAIFSHIRIQRRLQELMATVRQQETALLALHGAMKVIAEDVIHHGQSQSSVRRTLDRLTEQQTELRLRDTGAGLYPQAIQLIQAGRTREEVRKLCGLTQMEIDLLFSLHG